MGQEDIQQLNKKERRELRRQERTEEQEKMRSKRRATRVVLWGGTAVGIALVITGIVFVVLRGPGNSESDSFTSTSNISSGDWVKGNPEAQMTLIEYADFQCPACANYYPVVKALSEEFRDSVAITLRHFPLRQIHKNADLASRVAEAAGLQGKFWEMHDKLFEHQNDWANKTDAKDLFFAYASEIALDMDRFRRDLVSDAVRFAVEEDYNEGLKARVNGTPTFFLNGSRISNLSNYDEFKSLIQSKLNDANIPAS